MNEERPQERLLVYSLSVFALHPSNGGTEVYRCCKSICVEQPVTYPKLTKRYSIVGYSFHFIGNDENIQVASLQADN